MPGRIRRSLALAVSAAPSIAACAGVLHGGDGDARPSSTQASVALRDAAEARSRAADRDASASPTGANARLAAEDAGDGGRSAFAIAEGDCLNYREIHHRVTFEAVGPDAARFTATREFEPRFASMPFCMRADWWIGEDAVLETFALQTDGIWRKGTLGPERDDVDERPHPHGGPEQRPWASLAWSHGEYPARAMLVIPPFRVQHAIELRFTKWAYGAPTRTGREWRYCGDPHPSFGDFVVPEVSFSVADPRVTVRPVADVPECVDVERAEPPAKTLSARYGIDRLDGALWWWSVELAVPESLSPDPPPAEPGPVVFALDASRSIRHRGGLAPQIAIVKAFVRDVPRAEVEILLVNRTVDRVFGRFVPAKDVDAALGALANAPLGNGSFLDRGAERAAELLRAEGRPGRVILMTDGELRARFSRQAAVAALKRAPDGTIVHLIHPGVWPGSPPYFGPAVRHIVPEGLDALSAALGGASYEVFVDASDPWDAQPKAWRPSLASELAKLVRPDRVESLRLEDSQSSREWPAEYGVDSKSAGEARFGDPALWEGFSTRRPPESLALTGWIWGKKIELRVPRDAAFERSLPRIATARGTHRIDCKSPRSHRARALAEGFLAPALAFWVAGSGDSRDLVSSAMNDDCWELGDPGGSFSGGRGSVSMPRDDLTPRAGEALAACGLVPTATGAVRATVEFERGEVLDVSVEGGPDDRRRCAEEALWAIELPDDFDRWAPERQVRALRLEVKAAP